MSKLSGRPGSAVKRIHLMAGRWYAVLLIWLANTRSRSRAKAGPTCRRKWLALGATMDGCSRWLRNAPQSLSQSEQSCGADGRNGSSLTLVRVSAKHLACALPWSASPEVQAHVLCFDAVVLDTDACLCRVGKAPGPAGFSQLAVARRPSRVSGIGSSAGGVALMKIECPA